LSQISLLLPWQRGSLVEEVVCLTLFSSRTPKVAQAPQQYFDFSIQVESAITHFVSNFVAMATEVIPE